ncbi:MAG: RNA methyltransferase, partial [Sedimentisphaerales bacterium]|nr:RNA methyltransferase [Sedimentisphaerales bacterium]
TGRIAIVLGAEHAGLSPLWRHPAVTPVAIPMHGAMDSLNLAASGAILMYEALRQRST